VVTNFQNHGDISLLSESTLLEIRLLFQNALLCVRRASNDVSLRQTHAGQSVVRVAEDLPFDERLPETNDCIG